MKTATQIAEEIREYARILDTIADLLDPTGDLEKLNADLLNQTGDLEQLNAEVEQFYAPYGYKANGIPRKRPAPSAETLAKATASRRRTAAAKRASEKAEHDAITEKLRLSLKIDE